MLSKHTLDAGFGQFISILQWVCWKRRVYFSKVNKDYTSQVCPQCDTHTGLKELSDRIHACNECGYTTSRDIAAAQVIRNRGINKAFSGQMLCPETSRALGRSVDENVCGDGLTGAGNSLVKNQRSRKKEREARL